LNRVVERSPFGPPKVEIWDADPRGHWYRLLFYLPKGVSQQAVESAFRWYGRRWIDHLQRGGMLVREVLPAGPFPAPELDHLDDWLYVIQARATRTKPFVTDLDHGEQLLTNQPQREGLSIFRTFAHDQERQARENEEAKRQAVERERAWREAEAFRQGRVV